MRDALFFTKLRVFLGQWRWRAHRRASWMKARLLQLRRRSRRLVSSSRGSSSQHSGLPPQPSSAPRFVLDALEPRLLLSAAPVAVGDVYTIQQDTNLVGGTAIVKDISGNSSASAPTDLVDMNGTLFFSANDGFTGSELWRTDGTAVGTTMVKDINPGSGSSGPALATNVNGTLFFWATDPVNGAELWKSDGTAAGTILVKDIRAGNIGTSFSNFTNVNGTLFFTANDGVNGTELWKSDGTAAGTVLVKDIVSGAGSSNPTNLTNVNGMLYFSANDGVNGTELWKSDGTAAGTVLVKDIISGVGSPNPANFTNVNGTLFFTANDGVNGVELWKSDGTATSTVLVKDIFGGTASSNPASLTNMNGTLYFSANDGTSTGAHGVELWKSDGTAAGTVLVKDIFSGGGSSGPASLANINGTLFFGAQGASANGFELWRSDGTDVGTVLVKDIVSGPSSSFPTALTNVNGTLFFTVIDPTIGTELWKSDGTAAGTVLVKDIFSGNTSSFPQRLLNMNGTLFFTATDLTTGTEVWTSDGTAAGTSVVKDINVITPDASPSGLTNVNGTLFFSATDQANGTELWKSDGTATGTLLVKDIFTGGGGSGPLNLTNVNGTLFFIAFDGVNGQELRKSDGTAAGTVLVKDIVSGGTSSGISNLTNVNGTLYFTANNGTNGVELWKSDGTGVGTVLVKDIVSGTSSSNPTNLTNVNGTLFFTATDATNGTELWKTDGTEVGTVLVRNIAAGSSSALPTDLVNVNGALYFAANDGTNGVELWKSDGTEAGTVLLRDIRSGTSGSSPLRLTNVNGTLFFSADDGVNGRELWKSDGTAAGTVLVKNLSGSSSSSPGLLTNVGGTLFFTATETATGTELWKSDGTAAGTVLVKDILSGISASNPASLTNVNGTLFLKAFDFVNGTELWKSDGTANGTVLVKDIRSGSPSADPAGLVNLNGALLFSANDGVKGIELWATSGVPNLLANDTDADSTSLTTQLVSGPSHGTLVLNQDGTFVYKPNTGYTGTDSFSYQASDGVNLSNIATATITVQPSNAAPVAVDQSVTLAEDVPTPITLGASDADGNSLTFSIGTNPSHGTLSGGGSSWTYTPHQNYVGTDSFTFKTNDGIVDSNIATVSLTITPVNDAPVAQDDVFTVVKGDPSTYGPGAPGVLANDTDVDGDPLTAELFSGPSHGTLQLFPDGGFGYEPDPNSGFLGIDTFQYFVRDGNGGGSHPATVQIEVVTPPTASSQTVETAPGVPVTTQFGFQSLNHFFIGPRPNEFTVLQGPTQGAVTVDNEHGTFTYTPTTASFNGVDSFTYKVNDGWLDSNVATVTVVVDTPNQAPVANPDTFTVDEEVSATIDVLGNDHDADGDLLAVTAINGVSIIDGGVSVPVSGGTVALTGGQVPGAIVPNYTGPFLLVGGYLVFLSDVNYTGPVSFTYTISDGTMTATATVSGTVTSVNDAPVAVAQTVTTAEDTATTITLTGSDVDNDPLTYTIVAGPQHGTLTGAGATRTYTPNANYFGPDSFTFRVHDGTVDSAPATVSLTITPVKDAPVAVNDTLTATEDTPVTYTAAQLVGNDTDVDGDTLTIASVTSGVGGTVVLNNDGTVTFTPAANFNGAASFSYTVTDGDLPSDPATVTVTVAAVNNAPVAVAQTVTTTEDTATTITLTGNNIDGDPLTYTIMTEPQHGTLSGTGASRTYTPNANYHGPDSFTFAVNDGTVDSASATVTIDVTAVNDAPVAVSDALTATEDTPVTYTAAQLLGNDTDVDGDTLTIASVTSGVGGTVVLNGDGTVTLTPAANSHGPASFTYTVTDGNLTSNPATVTIDVTAVNDAPVAVSDALTATEDTPVTYTAAQLLGNDTDVDGDTLAIASATSGVGGTVALNGDGTVTLTPAANFHGPASFTYTVTDGNLTSNPATVTVNVVAVNNAPELAAVPDQAVNEGEPVTFTLQGSDADGGQTLTYGAVGLPSGAILDATTGEFRWTPSFVTVLPGGTNHSPSETLEYTFTVADGHGGTASTVVNITVNDVPAPPIARPDSIATPVDIPITILPAGLLANDTDPDEEQGPYFLGPASAPQFGTVTVTTDTTGYITALRYTPNPGFVGTDTFTYTIVDRPLQMGPNHIPLTDPYAQFATGQVTITVGNPTTNHPPVLAPIGDQTVDEGTELRFTVSGSDADQPTQLLTYSATGLPAGATFNAATREFRWTPAEAQGPNTFTGVTFTVEDGQGGTDSETISITVADVNNAPVLTPIGNQEVAEGSLLRFTATATDSEHDGLQFSLEGTVPEGATIDATTGVFTWTPTEVQGPGTFTVTVRVTDDGTPSRFAEQVVRISVGEVNNFPLVANPDTLTTAVDTPVVISLAELVSNDTDADVPSLPIRVVGFTTPQHGTITGDPLVSGTESVTYTPAPGFQGIDTIGYAIVDDAIVIIPPPLGSPEGTRPLWHFVDGGDDSNREASGVITITVGNPTANHPPVAAAQTVTTAEDTAKSITLTGDDVDNDPLTFTIVTGPQHGTLSGTGANRTYTPSANYNGPDSFTFTVNDGTVDSAIATVSIDVTPINDAPVAVADAATVAEGGTVTVLTGGAMSVLANDTDAEGDALTAVLVTGPTHGSLTLNANGTFSYTHDGSETTSDSFSYTVNDGTVDGNTVTVSLTITAVNDAPTALNDSYTVVTGAPLTVSAPGVLGNDTDSDTPAAGRSAELVMNVAHGTLSFNANGSFTYTATAGFVGQDTFTYRVNDGAVTHNLSNVATVTLTVQSATEPPLVINGTSGHDVIRVEELAGGVIQVTKNGVLSQYTLQPATHVQVFGLAGNDQIFLTGVLRPVLVDGGTGHDWLDARAVTSSLAPLDLRGRDGNDTLIGGAGDDRLNGGNGADLLLGGAGNDSLLGEAGSDFLVGGWGNDALDGGDGNDILLGGSGDDTLKGGAGGDSLVGGEGGDVLNGGTGTNLVLDWNPAAQATQNRLLATQPSWVRDFLG